MSNKKNGQNFSRSVAATERRKGALARLEAQLTSGVKPSKKTNKKVPLSKHDVKRIEKEISILKERL
jgi:hypothetical protein